MIERICKICKKEYLTYAYTLKTNRRKFCSVKCRGLSQIGNSGYWLGKHRSKETKRKIGLIWKGKKFSKEHKEKMSQAQLRRIARGGPCNFVKGHKMRLGSKQTEETKEKLRQYFKNRPKPLRSYKHRRNIALAKMGEKNPQWINGKSLEPYPLGWNKTYKEQIRHRDNYKCRMCGKPEVENMKRLCVHHIDYDKSNLDFNNLISLCSSCHSATNANRKKWESICRLEVKA